MILIFSNIFNRSNKSLLQRRSHEQCHKYCLFSCHLENIVLFLYSYTVYGTISNSFMFQIGMNPIYSSQPAIVTYRVPCCSFTMRQKSLSKTFILSSPHSSVRMSCLPPPELLKLKTHLFRHQSTTLKQSNCKKRKKILFFLFSPFILCD